MFIITSPFQYFLLSKLAVVISVTFSFVVFPQAKFRILSFQELELLNLLVTQEVDLQLW